MIDICTTFLGFTQRTNRHKLAGNVTVDGQPAKRFVSVFNRNDFSWIATVLSDQLTGVWMIRGLPEYPERSLLVIAVDTLGSYNAEVADYISQVATA